MLGEKSYLRFLNKNCPINEEWKSKDKVYQIRIHKDDEEKLSEWVEKIIGCSFFYELDTDDYLNLKVTKSTLESHLSDTIIEDKFNYTPVKMDRFSLVKGEDHYEGCYYIVDNLIRDIKNRNNGLYKTGRIFTACSESEWVNITLCQEVLRLLNTEESYVKMLDYVENK